MEDREETPPKIIPLKLIQNSDEIPRDNCINFTLQNDKIKFISSNPNLNVDGQNSLYFQDILVIKENELVEIIKKEKPGKEDNVFPQSIKFCNSCHCYFYHHRSHKDSKHKIVANLYQDMTARKRKVNQNLKLIVQDQEQQTECGYYRNDRLIIYSESTAARVINIKLKNLSNETITVKKCIGDNTRNGFIYWGGGIQQGDLQVYQLEEEIQPNNLSTQIIQIHLPGEIQASKDLTLKIKVRDNKSVDHLYDSEITVFSNYTEPTGETPSIPRIQDQWKYVKGDREDLKDDINTKASYATSTLFDSTSMYFHLQNKIKDYPTTATLSNVSFKDPNLNNIIRTVGEETTRDNWKEKMTHFIKSELVHYLSELQCIDTVVISKKDVDLKTRLVLDLDLQSLTKLNIKQNETILLKVDETKIVEAKVVISETRKTTILTETLLSIEPGKSVQITPPLRVIPFSHMMRALDMVKSNVDIAVHTKNYFLPNQIRTKNTDSCIQIDDTSLDEDQVTAIKKIDNLQPGDVFILQGPPGTGKSRVIIEAINQLMKKGQTVLLICQTNSAACDMYARMKSSTSLKGRKITKISSPAARVERTCETFCENLKDGDQRHGFPSTESIKEAQIIICTTLTSHRLNNLKENDKDETKGFSKTSSTIMIDEGAYAHEASLLVPIVSNIMGGEKGFKLIIVGDPLQLNNNPRSVLSKYADNTDMMTRIMKYLKPYPTNFHILRNNYRNGSLIVELLNEISYEGQLICKSTDRGTITLIHAETSKQSLNNTQSKCSTPEAAATVRYVKTQPKNESFKVLSYYSAQKVKILEVAESEQCHNIQSNTVESVQGLESNNIILTTILPSLNNTWQLSNQRLNVIVSRCKQNLIMVGDLLELSSHQLFRTVIWKGLEEGKIIAPVHIKTILKQRKFQADEEKTRKKRKKVN